MSSILTVSQLNRYLASKIKSDVKLTGIAVKGELSNYTVNSRSGHAYFSLKDEGSVIRGVMFSTNVKRLKFTPENGMAVLAVGNINLYERDGVLQITALEISPIGVGAVRTGLDQLKKKLADRGVFDTAAKKKIPVLPKKIAVVTSLTADALQDIKNVLGRRCPIVKVEVFPAQVQGETAPDTIANALKRADRSGADTIILARGGGSDEDLMAFNTEKAALAVFECETPIITAVGHETDTTLVDYAADLRAPTPSAAAELAVPMMSQLVGTVELMEQKLSEAMLDRISRLDRRLSELDTALRLSSPTVRITNEEKKLESLSLRLDNSIKKRLESESMLVDKYAAQLSALSPFNILDRGYSITMKDGVPVNASGLSAGDEINVRFADGTALAEIKQVYKNDI
ncbi:Exodeoxyribonuclease VII large subunit [Ruminococcaceae bacterium FB2012]|nr:Exodeoxyribonuclease VII large subunit [Ruminococcaceae bacterium FB2012]